MEMYGKFLCGSSPPLVLCGTKKKQNKGGCLFAAPLNNKPGRTFGMTVFPPGLALITSVSLEQHCEGGGWSSAGTR